MTYSQELRRDVDVSHYMAKFYGAFAVASWVGLLVALVPHHHLGGIVLFGIAAPAFTSASFAFVLDVRRMTYQSSAIMVSGGGG